VFIRKYVCAAVRNMYLDGQFVFIGLYEECEERFFIFFNFITYIL